MNFYLFLQHITKMSPRSLISHFCNTKSSQNRDQALKKTPLNHALQLLINCIFLQCIVNFNQLNALLKNKRQIYINILLTA